MASDARLRGRFGHHVSCHPRRCGDLEKDRQKEDLYHFSSDLDCWLRPFLVLVCSRQALLVLVRPALSLVRNRRTVYVDDVDDGGRLRSGRAQQRQAS